MYISLPDQETAACCCCLSTLPSLTLLQLKGDPSVPIPCYS
jgi:hypothetical protein